MIGLKLYTYSIHTQYISQNKNMTNNCHGSKYPWIDNIKKQLIIAWLCKQMWMNIYTIINSKLRHDTLNHANSCDWIKDSLYCESKYNDIWWPSTHIMSTYICCTQNWQTCTICFIILLPYTIHLAYMLALKVWYIYTISVLESVWHYINHRLIKIVEYMVEIYKVCLKLYTYS